MPVCLYLQTTFLVVYDYDVPASRASAPMKTKLVSLAGDAASDRPLPTEPVMLENLICRIMILMRSRLLAIDCYVANRPWM